MKLNIKRDSTNITIVVFIQDSTATDGSGLTGLVYNSAGLTCYYVRPGGAAAQLTLATQTVTGAHTDGGFVEIDATNMPGFYRLDLSDALVASGSPAIVGHDSVAVMLKGAANMAPLPIEIQIVELDPQVAMVTKEDVADQVWDEAKSGHTSSGSFGEEVQLHALTSELISAAPTAAAVADKILGRSLAGGADDASRNVANALRALRNRVARVGGTQTVYEEDDSTPAWTAAVTTTAGDPVTEVDPT